MSEAYISWYFTLAHEIAHNLVSQHDSEHEVGCAKCCSAGRIAHDHLHCRCSSTCPASARHS